MCILCPDSAGRLVRDQEWKDEWRRLREEKAGTKRCVCVGGGGHPSMTPQSNTTHLHCRSRPILSVAEVLCRSDMVSSFICLTLLVSTNCLEHVPGTWAMGHLGTSNAPHGRDSVSMHRKYVGLSSKRERVDDSMFLGRDPQGGGSF